MLKNLEWSLGIYVWDDVEARHLKIRRVKVSIDSYESSAIE